jgi:outer membrane protein OmpA-like peptidoglycan-associated protein
MLALARLLLLILVLCQVLCQPALAAEPEFATSADEILRGLTAPRPGSTSGTGGSDLKVAWGSGSMKKLTVLVEEDGSPARREIEVPEAGLCGGVNLKIEFDVNADTIRPGSKPLLNELGKALTNARVRDKPVEIRGHTDADGSDVANLELSFRRAMAVKRYLSANFDLDAGRLSVAGYGEAAPLAPNTTREFKQMNRRVEVVLVDKAW